MARIDKTITVARTPDDVWRVVGDVGSISAWMPAITASSSDSGTRECTLEGGGTMREEIVSRDEEGRRYEFRLSEAPFPFEHHHASISVEAEGDGARITWVTDMAPDEVAAQMEPMFQAGIETLRAQLEGV